MRITTISDTHTKHYACEKDLPGGDLLIHSGDFMNSGYSYAEAKLFFEWFDRIDNYDTKVFISGNHDRMMEINPEWGKSELVYSKSIDYLQDTALDLWDEFDAQIRIYGSPWQPEFHSWAFNLPRNSDVLKSKWDAIPHDTDILITHGPPFGHLDIPGGQSLRVGCELLRYRVDEIKPKIHVFGHIHGGAGYYYNGHTHFINAAILDERYVYANLPQTFDWNPITNEIKWISVA